MAVLVGVFGAGAIAWPARADRMADWMRGFLCWQDRQRRRAALTDLDARLLRDVGLSRDEAEREGRRND
jgi:uncharacterized protein YjiS (DUF1127 family)